MTTSEIESSSEDLASVLLNAGWTRATEASRLRIFKGAMIRNLMEAGVSLLNEDLVRYAGPTRTDRDKPPLFEKLSWDRLAVGTTEKLVDADPDFAVSRDTIRNIWSHVWRYSEDLIAYVFRPERNNEHITFAEENLEDLLAGKLFGEVIQLLCEYEIDHYLGDAHSNVQFVIQAAMPEHPRVRAYTTALYDSLLPRWAKIYEHIAGAYGIQFVNGITFVGMALMLNTLIDGELMRSRAEGPTWQVGGRSLLESAVLAVVSGSTGIPLAKLIELEQISPNQYERAVTTA